MFFWRFQPAGALTIGAEAGAAPGARALTAIAIAPSEMRMAKAAAASSRLERGTDGLPLLRCLAPDSQDDREGALRGSSVRCPICRVAGGLRLARAGSGWVRNSVERFLALREDVAGGMGGTRAVG